MYIMYTYIYIYIYVSRHAITKYTRKNKKNYSIKKIRCFMMHCIDTNCLGLIII